MNWQKLFSVDYYHRKFYRWLQSRKSHAFAWVLSRERYYNETGRKLSYRNPGDINQKLMWLNRYSNDPKRAKCADKYLVRDYVIKCGYEDILIPLLGIWEKVDDIKFDQLSDKFVLKCNHGAGMNVICKGKSIFDETEAKRKLDKWMGGCYDSMLQEKHYRLIKPRIICEQYLEQLNGGIIDYKFHCFNGKVHSCFVAYNRDVNNPLHSVDFDHYDIDWHLTEAIKPEFHKNRIVIQKPHCFERMLKICSDLSKGFPYVRVDLYEVNERVYFGEMTFTPNGNIMNYYSQEMLNELGKQLILPDKNKLLLFPTLLEGGLYLE